MKNLFDAFISYGRADSKAFATKLHAKLVKVGLKVWFDQNDIPLGVDFQNQIDDGIEKAQNFLFIISPHSVKSLYCRKEIELAVQHNKRIIPLLHIEPSDCWDQLHPTIGKINWVFFREEQDTFETSFAGLGSLIHHQADYVEQHTHFLVQALEWERNQKQTNYLLIGEERIDAESWLKIRFKDEQPPCVPTDLHCEFICESTKNANNLMTQVFLAYSDQDRAVMEKICKSLMREGLTIWTNRKDIKTGTDFQIKINQGIEGTDNLIYLISPDSLQSQYCQDELAYAFATNKRIIPLLVEPTNIEEIPLKIRGLQFINFTTYQDEERYTIDINKLLKQLKQEAHYYEQHKILLVKALKWLRQNRNPSILLRGYNLQQAEAWLKVALQLQEHPPLLLHQEFITESLNQSTDASLEVFISYSRADSDLARKLNEALQLQGKKTWFDQESIASGSDFKQEIYRGIENSDNFLFIISSKSVKSPYCKDEVEYAQQLNKRFVPILHQDVAAQEIHPALARVQWIDFNRYGGDFYANFSELVRTLDIDREYVRSHTKWSQRAIEWEQKGRDDSFLLRGSNLHEAQQWLQVWLASTPFQQPEPTTLQTNYILQSYQVQTQQINAAKARQQAEFDRQKAQIKLQRIALAGVSLALLVAVCLGVAAFSEYRKAQEQQIKASVAESEARFTLHNQLPAMIASIQSIQRIKRKNWLHPDTKLQAETVLREFVYGIQEHNRLQKHSNRVWSISFSPDGQMLASGSEDGTIALWNKDGRLLKTLNGQGGRILCVSFSPDGETLATASSDKTVKLWSKNGTLLSILRGHQNNVNSVSFSSDSQTIATASTDKTAKLWTNKGILLQNLQGHTDSVKSVSFSRDGLSIVTGSKDRTVKLWSQEGKLLRTLADHTDEVNQVSFSPDDQMIASASRDKTIKLWKRDGTFLRTLSQHSQAVNSIAWSPDSQKIASASVNNLVQLWSYDGNLLTNLEGHSDTVLDVKFSPDGQTIASASADSTVRLWKSDNTFLKTLNAHDDSVYSVLFSPDGQVLASGSADGMIKLWQADGTLSKILKGHSDRINRMSFSPDGQVLASASDDNTVKLWSKDGVLLQTFDAHNAGVRSITFSPDGQMLASASEDSTVKLWNRQGKILKVLKGHHGAVGDVTFSPDSKLIATSGDDKTVKLWTIDGKWLKTLTSHHNHVRTVRFSPDGKMIATSSRDSTVKLWSREGILLKTLSGHTDGVREVNFSPDGKMIATGGGDQTIKLWNNQGIMLKIFKGHFSRVLSISFSPDGRTLATGSADNTMRLWQLYGTDGHQLTLDELLVNACRWAHDYLKTNPNLSEDSRHICDGIDTQH